MELESFLNDLSQNISYFNKYFNIYYECSENIYDTHGSITTQCNLTSDVINFLLSNIKPNTYIEKSLLIENNSYNIEDYINKVFTNMKSNDGVNIIVELPDFDHVFNVIIDKYGNSFITQSYLKVYKMRIKKFTTTKGVINFLNKLSNNETQQLFNVKSTEKIGRILISNPYYFKFTSVLKQIQILDAKTIKKIEEVNEFKKITQSKLLNLDSRLEIEPKSEITSELRNYYYQIIKFCNIYYKTTYDFGETEFISYYIEMFQDTYDKFLLLMNSDNYNFTHIALSKIIKYTFKIISNVEEDLKIFQVKLFSLSTFQSIYFTPRNSKRNQHNNSEGYNSPEQPMQMQTQIQNDKRQQQQDKAYHQQIKRLKQIKQLQHARRIIQAHSHPQQTQQDEFQTVAVARFYNYL